MAWLLCLGAAIYQPPKRLVVILTGHRKGHFESCGCSGVKAISSISKEAALINRTRADLVRKGATVLVVDIGGNLTGLRHDSVFKDYLRRFDYAAELNKSRPGIDWTPTTGLLAVEHTRLRVKIGPLEIEFEGQTIQAPDHEALVVLESGKPPQRLIVTGLKEEDPSVEALLEGARQKDREAFLAKMIALSEPPAPQDDPAACGKCHETAYKSWSKSGHAHALTTLIDKKKAIHECILCHSTNYQGSKKIELAREDPKQSVTCVSCHDLTGAHRADLTKPFKEKLEEKVCLPCHTPENSIKFKFSDYVKRVHRR